MRPAWRLWLIVYIGCGLVLLAGLAVGAYAMMSLEREQAWIRAEAGRRLAVDRVVRELDLVIVGRFVRPEAFRRVRDYLPFASRDWAQVPFVDEARDGQPIAPSPLLLSALGEPLEAEEADSLARLHFQISERAGRVRVVSPTAFLGADRQWDRYLRDLMIEIEARTGRSPDEMRAVLELSSDRLGELEEILGGRGLAFGDDQLELSIRDAMLGESAADDRVPSWNELRAMVAGQPDFVSAINEIERLDRELRNAEGGPSAATEQALRALKETLANPAERASAEETFRHFAGRMGEAIRANRQRENRMKDLMDLGGPPERGLLAGEGMRIAEPSLVWRYDPQGEPQLFLLREVTTPDAVLLQGVWIDWSGLRADLEQRAQEIFPAATIEPVSGLGGPVFGARLAQAPIVVRAPKEIRPAQDGMTPTRWAILTMCATVIGAYLAVGLALQGSAALAARRGRFVSAVTHELRTPLTTFKLYTEMLADGLIRDEDKKQEYLATLKSESVRLGSIVENVLTYAKLSPGRRKRLGAATDLSSFIDRVEGPLRRCAEQAEMTLEIDLADVEGVSMLADAATAERVLVNLVDNAAKYAGDATDRRVHLAVRGPRGSGDGRVRFWVGDHGPGVAPKDRGKIFDEFRRGRRKADTAKGGLGLGLALSRGLAVDSGGGLRLARSGRGPLIGCVGAVFLLELPGKREVYHPQ